MHVYVAVFNLLKIEGCDLRPQLFYRSTLA
jgi:hypothetical protein